MNFWCAKISQKKNISRHRLRQTSCSALSFHKSQLNNYNSSKLNWCPIPNLSISGQQCWTSTQKWNPKSEPFSTIPKGLFSWVRSIRIHKVQISQILPSTPTFYPTSLPWHMQESIELLLQHLISLHLHWHLNRPGAEFHKSCSFLGSFFLEILKFIIKLVIFEIHHQDEILYGISKLLKLFFEQGNSIINSSQCARPSSQ